MKLFKFKYDDDGFQMLQSRLNSLSHGNGNIIIGLESTTHYNANLVRYLVASHYKVCALNPIKTLVMRKGNIRKVKTDIVDTSSLPKSYDTGLLQACPFL